MIKIKVIVVRLYTLPQPRKRVERRTKENKSKLTLSLYAFEQAKVSKFRLCLAYLWIMRNIEMNMREGGQTNSEMRDKYEKMRSEL